MSTDTILTLALGLPLWAWLLAEVFFGWPGWLDRREREVVCIGWDGASRPMYRYRDELHLPDYMRTHVSPRDRRPW